MIQSYLLNTRSCCAKWSFFLNTESSLETLLLGAMQPSIVICHSWPPGPNTFHHLSDLPLEKMKNKWVLRKKDLSLRPANHVSARAL